MKAELTPGAVALVGGGPGDPDLMTVAGMRALQQADVIVYDRLAPLDCLLAAGPDALLIDVGKVPRGAQTPQETINALLVAHARTGARVVRFKGGDNFVFGRGGEEWLACAAEGISVDVIPGVSSAVAGPAAAGIPVTHRSLTQGFTVVSGHVAPDDPRSTVGWDHLAACGTTLVILMGVLNLPAISARLIRAGMPESTPAAVVASAFDPGMRVLRAPVAEIAAAAAESQIQPPAIVVVGDVAALDFTSDARQLAQAWEGQA